MSTFLRYAITGQRAAAGVSASQGDLPLALEVIQNSSKGEDPAKANDYISVAGWLAEHHDF
jgi:hypothetical protein